MHKHPEITPGMRVRYSCRFLRAIGAYTGPMGQGRGTVIGLVPLGESVLAQIVWDNPEKLPGRVLTANLWPIGRPEPD